MTTATLPNLGSVIQEISDEGNELSLSQQSIENIADCGFRGENLKLALVAVDILVQEQPVTLRGLMYQLVSCGMLPSTDAKHYRRTGRLLTRLRQEGVVPYRWIVDGMRSTLKPSSWSGIEDFADTVRSAYRMDFWARLPVYVHVICEKDAIAGTLSPVTREYDVRLSPLRGYSSLSFAHEIAETWNQTKKPIFCYFLGDYDASGFDLERDIKQKLKEHTSETHPEWHELNREERLPGVGADAVVWQRLGVNLEDFEDFHLLPLEVKDRDRRAKQFRIDRGDEAAELDAIPSAELRRRLKVAIENHIPTEEWGKLTEIERNEKETFNAVLDQLSNARPEPPEN